MYWEKLSNWISCFIRGLDTLYSSTGFAHSIIPTSAPSWVWDIVGVPLVALSAAFQSIFRTREQISLGACSNIHFDPSLAFILRAWGIMDMQAMMSLLVPVLGKVVYGMKVVKKVEICGIICTIISASDLPTSNQDQSEEKEERGGESKKLEPGCGETDAIFWVHGGGWVAHSHLSDMGFTIL